MVICKNVASRVMGTARTPPWDLPLPVQWGSQGQWPPQRGAFHFLTPSLSQSTSRKLLLPNKMYYFIPNCFYNSKAYITASQSF